MARMLDIVHQMREMITFERSEGNRLREQNMRLRQACAKHGLDIERILS